jgi:hypothetical protein
MTAVPPLRSLGRFVRSATRIFTKHRALAGNQKDTEEDRQ